MVSKFHLAILFSVTVIFSSCNRPQANFSTLRLTNGCFTAEIDSGDWNKVSLTVINLSDSVAFFYLTPAGFDFFNDSTIVHSVIKDTMSGEQKCKTLWQFVCDWSYHAKTSNTNDEKMYSPAFFLNGVEGGFCDTRNIVLANLAKSAGIKSRVIDLRGHVVSELFYKNGWHLFDADKEIYFEKEKGGIAGVAELEAQPEMIASKVGELKTIIQKWRNRQTQKAIESKPNDILGINDPDDKYCSIIQLKKGQKISFSVSPSAFLSRTVNADFLEKGGPYYLREGEFVALYDLNLSDTSATIIEQKLPYPISALSLTSSNPTPLNVFCSIDKVNWHYKGQVSEKAKIQFQTYSESKSGFITQYFIKVENGEGRKPATSRLKITSGFSFSDKMLVNNPEHSFRIIPLNNAAKELKVTFYAEK